LKLSQWQAHSSYNHNARYYALPGVPRFDHNGLWRFRDIGFSKHGTLKNTVVHLVHASAGGLTGTELGQLLGLSARSFLHHFRDTPGIYREKHAGVYVYFCEHQQQYTAQRSARATTIALAPHALSEADIIIILAALITHHNLSAQNILALPQVKARKLSPVAVHSFFQRHGLLKKTPDSKP